MPGYTLQKFIAVVPFLVVALFLVWKTKHGWRYALGAVVGTVMLSVSVNATWRARLWWSDYKKRHTPPTAAYWGTTVNGLRTVRFQRDSVAGVVRVETPPTSLSALRYRAADGRAAMPVPIPRGMEARVSPDGRVRIVLQRP